MALGADEAVPSSQVFVHKTSVREVFHPLSNLQTNGHLWSKQKKGQEDV